MGIRVAEVTVDEWAARVGPLVADHWLELATDKALMVLKPDLDVYRVAEDAGRLLALAMFDTFSEAMIGYSVCLIGPHPHYADLVLSQNDVIYVDPKHRDTLAGMRLIRETEARSKARGARLMTWHAKPRTALDNLLPRVGYRVQDIIHSREL